MSARLRSGLRSENFCAVSDRNAFSCMATAKSRVFLSTSRFPFGEQRRYSRAVISCSSAWCPMSLAMLRSITLNPFNHDHHEKSIGRVGLNGFTECINCLRDASRALVVSKTHVLCSMHNHLASPLRSLLSPPAMPSNRGTKTSSLKSEINS